MSRLTPLVENQIPRERVDRGCEDLRHPAAGAFGCSGSSVDSRFVRRSRVDARDSVFQCCEFDARQSLPAPSGDYDPGCLGCSKEPDRQSSRDREPDCLLLGGAAGIGLTSAAVGILNESRSLALAGFPEISVDAATIGFTLALSVLVGLIFGLAPALSALRFSVSGALQQESRGSVGSVGLRRLRQGLVIVQLAASLTLLIGSGLLAKSFLKLRESDPGFKPSGY